MCFQGGWGEGLDKSGESGEELCFESGVGELVGDEGLHHLAVEEAVELYQCAF